MSTQETLKVFDELYETTYYDISKYVVSNCSKLDDVEDIIQNIYLEVYKNISKNKSITKSYIIGIAKNKVKDYYRFRYKEKLVSLFSSKNDIELLDNIPSDINIEESILLKYDTALVWKYLKNKKPVVSKIFYLYYNLELTIKEISECLNITESNVKHYLYRTIKELKSYLERE